MEILTYNARIRLYDADELAIQSLKKTDTSPKSLPQDPLEKN